MPPSPAPSAEPISLGIVIPTCNRQLELERCLMALRLQVEAAREMGIDIDVVVMDDGTSQAPTLADFPPWARQMAGPHQGRSANRNAGAQAASGAWLAFIDDDIIPEGTWIRAYLDQIAVCDADVLEGRVIADRPRRAFNEISPINLEGGALWSCNFAIRRSVFEHIGGFDETYVHPGLEDTDLRLRLASAGAVTVFVRDATVCHPWRRTDLRESLARFGNLDKFLDRHPNEVAQYNARRFGRGVLHTMKVLVKNVIPYKARGIGFQVGYAAVAALISIRLWRRERRSVSHE